MAIEDGDRDERRPMAGPPARTPPPATHVRDRDVSLLERARLLMRANALGAAPISQALSFRELDDPGRMLGARGSSDPASGGAGGATAEERRLVEDADSPYRWRSAAIVFLDAVGYSGMIERSTLTTRPRVKALVDEAERLSAEAGGRMVERAGDGAFLEFARSADAVRAMLRFREAVDAANEGRGADARILFRIGIAAGQVLHDGELPAGSVVNTAKRLETLAEPGSLNVSGHAYDALPQEERARFRDMGFRVLKGQDVPVRLWRSANRDELTQLSAVEMARDYVRAAEPSQGFGAGASPATATDEARSIAVLNFVDASPDGQDSFFAEGLAGDIVSGLSKSRALLVVSPRSSFLHVRGPSQEGERSPGDIARELGVRYLVEGRVRRYRVGGGGRPNRDTGDRIRVSVSLVYCPPADEAHGGSLVGTKPARVVWSQNYDRAANHILTIQDEVADAIVSTIEPEFHRSEHERAAVETPRNMAHWELTMRAYYHFWRPSRRANANAFDIATQALALGPRDSGTHALIALILIQRMWAGWADDSGRDLEEAIRMASLAVRFDGQNAHAHFVLGATMTVAERQEDAGRCQERALELNPHFAAAMGELGRVHAHCGRTTEARDVTLRAIRRSATDPHLSLWIRNLALADIVDRNYASAVRFAREAASTQPDWSFHFDLLAAALWLAGEKREAREAFAEARRLKPVYTMQAFRAALPFQSRWTTRRLVKALKGCGWEPA